MIEPSRLSLNTATVREQWTLAECIDGCQRHGIGGIAPWRDKLIECSVEDAARRIRAAGLRVSGLCRGGWYTADGWLSDVVLDDNFRAVDEAEAIGAECLVMVVGGLSPGTKDIVGAREIVAEGLQRTLEYARQAKVPLAIEPLHPMYAADRACVNTLSQALDLCDQLGPGIGVALDVYHVWWDPDLAAGIERAGRERLLAFHICDWLVPTHDLLLDRGMPGDGVIDIAGIREMVDATGYDALVEVEIFSAGDWWTRDPDTVLQEMVARGRRVV